MLTPLPFANRILRWYDQYGRKHLPWKQNPTPYRVWISEIMLQQTQVATVIPYYERFMKSFPSVNILAQASLDEVLHHWSGLGYYARARNLHKTAITIFKEHEGEFPLSVEELMQLPGIGRSTAGAILSLSQNKVAPILEGNVKRIFTRYHGIEGWPAHTTVLKKLWDIAEKYTPYLRAADYNQALMDIGSAICTRSRPLCYQCPIHSSCHAFQTNSQSQYPSPKPKKTERNHQKTIFAILINAQGECLLEKRSPTGIWGGLWGFPELGFSEDIPVWCRLKGYGSVEKTYKLPSFLHVFTHFDLTINPLLVYLKEEHPACMESSSQIWYKLGHALPGGIASPVKKLLTQLEMIACNEKSIV